MAAIGAGCDTPPERAIARHIEPVRSLEYGAGSPSPATFAPGDTLPSGRFNVMLNTEYFGLPPVSGDWRYYRVEDRVMRVRNRTFEVLEDVTHLTNAAF